MLVVTLLCVLNVGSARAISSSQQPATNSCQPLDIIFVIEHSSYIDDADASDYRMDLIRNLTEFLGYDYMYHCDGLPHRMAIVSFDGNHAEVDLELTPLSPLASQPQQEWVADIEDQLADFSERDGWEGRDFELVFDEVHKLINEEDFSVGIERKKVVFVITALYGASQPDGMDFIPINVEKNLSALKASLENWNFDPGTGPFLHVFAFENGPIEYKQRASDGWKNIVPIFGGEYELIDAEEPFEIGVRAVRRILSLTDQSAQRLVQAVNCPEIFVEPMTENFAMLVLSNDIGTDVSLINTDTTNEVEIRELYDQISPVVNFNLPEPGKWKLESNKCGEILAVYTDTLIKPHFSTNIKADHQETQCDQSKFKCEPPTLTLTLVDAEGNSIPIYDKYEPTVFGSIKTPAQRDIPISFKYHNAEKVYIAQNPIAAEDYGVFTVSLNASIDTITPPNSQSITLGSESFDYEVLQVIPFDLAIVSPKQGEKIELYSTISTGLVPQTMDVIVKIVAEDGSILLDANDKGVILEDIFGSNAENLIEVVLTHDRTDRTEAVWLTSSESSPDAFEGRLTNLSEIGDYTLEIRTADSIDQSISLGYGILEEEHKINLERICSPLSCPYTVEVARWTGIVLAGVLVLVITYAFTAPVRGSLEFYAAGECNPIFVTNLPLRRGIPTRWANLKNHAITNNSRIISFIGKIKVRMKGKNAILVRILDKDGKKIFKKNKMFVEGELEKLPHGLQFRYVQPKTIPIQTQEDTEYEEDEE